MKEIILPQEASKLTVDMSDVDPHQEPIFAQEGDKFIGMLIYSDRGWWLAIGGQAGANGYHETAEECMSTCEKKFGYKFYV